MSRKKQKLDVARILQQHGEGMRRDYDVLVSQLADTNLQDDLLLSALGGLKSCVMLLTKEYETLVGVILRLSWTGREAAVVQEYQSFVINLLSAHTVYLRATLRMLVKQFSPKVEARPGDEAFRVDPTVGQKNDSMFLSLHQLLRAIIQVVPMTHVMLMPMLGDCFPHLTKVSYVQECYVKNLLQLTEYLPSCRAKILELIIDRMTKLDVRSPREDIQEAEGEDSDMETDVIFDMELNGDVSQGADPLRSSTLEEGRPMSHAEADRLDVMMDLLLRYIQNVCYKNGELAWENTKKLYKELLYVFERIILPTHASCHIQFIMFYICSFKEPLFEGFLDYLWKKVQDPNTQPIFRQAAVAYIASLLARAKYISVTTVKACLELISNWVNKYIQEAAYTSTKADITHHGPFYSTCQALFYIITFRHKDILEDKKGLAFAQNLNLQTMITSRLNPLRVCLPVVAKTFSSVARIHQLAFCDTIMEKNRRSLLLFTSSEHVQQSRLTMQNPLDSFFPFDPYLLSRSGKFVLPLYREYEGTPVQDENDLIEEDAFDEGQETEATPGSLGMIPSSLPIESPKSPTDLLMYSVSPGFRHLRD